jgi:hypothetical protein
MSMAPFVLFSGRVRIRPGGLYRWPVGSHDAREDETESHLVLSHFELV